MRLPIATLLPLLGLCVAQPARADLLRAIDARHASGAIDAETRHYYRVAALKDRDLLPPDLRRLPLDPAARRDATRITVEAAQWVIRNQAQPGRVGRLLLPPPDLMSVLDSSTLPIRVTYKSTSTLAQAQQVLAAAENAWTIETGDYGFPVPAIEPGAGRFRIYIDDTGMGGGAYTVPYAEDPSTARSDCFSYIVYDPTNSTSECPGVVAHELNHAMQATLDCLESWVFMENTATYIMCQIDPPSWQYAYYLMNVFQTHPWRALDYNNYSQMDGYEYGGVLWPIYLTSAYAPQDGPVFMRRVWEACVQDDTTNSKDYFEAVKEVVAASGGPAALETVFADFSEARYFVGTDSDGAHIPAAASFATCEVTTVAHYGTASLPIVGAKPTTDKQPATYGANHVELTLGGNYTTRLRVSFDGADQTRWAARVLLVGGGATESLPLTLDATTQAGVLEVDPTGRTKLVLVIANLATPAYTPNDMHWPTADYSFSIEPVLVAPTLTALIPDDLEQGAVGVTMTLQGNGFVNGPDFAVGFDDPTLYVAWLASVTATEVKFVMTVPAETPLGPKTVIVTNSGGLQAEGPGFLTVIAPETDGGTDGGGGGGSGGGCGCSSSSGPGPVAGVVLLLLALPFGRRRRR